MHRQRVTRPMELDGFEELIRSAQQGDREAMDRVLEILRPYLDSLARPFADPSRPAESTSDLLQECCLRAWRKLDSFQGGENDQETFGMFRAWLGQIVRRLGMNAQRDVLARKRIPPQKLLPLDAAAKESKDLGSELGLPARTPTPSAVARADEMAQQIQDALENMEDETASEIVRMRFFEGLTISRISERVDLTPVRVRERLRSAMKRLRRDLGKWVDEWL